MHYRNGREAKNGDKVLSLASWQSPVVGVLYDAVPGNDYCNGMIAPLGGGNHIGACMCDCLHIDDVMSILAEKGMDKRPDPLECKPIQPRPVSAPPRRL